jgi:uncharacterized membrane protein YhhN
LALLAWFTLDGGLQGTLAWFAAGLFFSLLGDILLLLPGRFFVLGGASFFITHLLYITSFILGFSIQPSAVLALSTWFPGGAISGGAISGGAIYGTAWLSVRTRPKRTRPGGWRKSLMKTGVGIYALTLVVMTGIAISTLWQPGWKETAAAMVAVGAILFLLSDAVLIYDHFVQASRFAPLLVMVTYHTGQILLAAGVLANFTSTV